MRQQHDTTRILTVVGFFSLAAGLLFNPFLVRALAQVLPGVDLGGVGLPTDVVFRKVVISEIVLIALGGSSLALRAGILRSVRLAILFSRPWTGKLALALVSFVLPLLLLELLLRPFVWDPSPSTEGGTPIFVRDTTLGWRLNPGTTGNWGGHQVSVNEQGLRGPVVPLQRDEAALRLLYLGDSVTFGYMVEPYPRAYPFVTGRLLEERTGGTVETVNGGVGGYSPWQEALWLRREGLAYSPDVVIQGFVLNDVTEKFDLVRFGGSGEGAQLRDARVGGFERLVWRSGILYTARKLNARLRFGADVRAGAIEHQRLNIGALLHEPDQEHVRSAWAATLASMDEIIQTCADHEIPLVVVLFPSRLQMGAAPPLDAPQRTLLAHLEARGVPTLDLLPVVTQLAAEQSSPFFIDDDHPTALGHRIVADELARFLVALGLAPAP